MKRKANNVLKKVLCLFICLIMVLSLGACGKSDENNDGTKSEVAEKIDKQEKNSLKSKDASLKYIGLEKANEQLAGDRDNMYIFKFDFVNNTSEPKEPQNYYSISFFQNGQELQDSFSTVIIGENEQHNLIQKFYNKVMDGGKLTFAKMVQTEDDSPVTIYMEANSSKNDPVSFKVDIKNALKSEVKNDEVKTTEVESTTGNIDDSWKKDFYVDNFQQKTDEGFVYIYTNGTFSNSATTNSKLFVELLADMKRVSIFLWEYERNPVKNPYSKNKNYDITIKTSNGQEQKLYGKIFSDGDRININDNYYSKVIEILSKEENYPISFYVEANDFMSTYLFTVNSSNFAEQYNSLLAN